MAQCEKCGNTITEGATFCTNCGAPVTANNITNNNQEGLLENQINQSTTQPTMTQSMQSNPQPNSQASTIPNLTDEKNTKKEKKKFLVPIIAMSAISVICLGVGIAGIVIGTNNKDKSSETPSSTTTNTITPPNTEGGSGTSSNATQVQINKYEISIPDDFEYLANNDRITILPKTQSTWAAQIEYSESSTYAQVESGIENIIQSGETEIGGMTSTGDYIEVDGTKYPYLNIVDLSNNENYTTVFSKAGLYIIMGTIMNKDNSKPSIEIVRTIAEILATAKQKKELNSSTYDSETEQNLQRVQNKILQNFTTEQ